VKIYELKRNDRFTVPDLYDMPVLTFSHMDGMYCFARTDDGQVANIAGYAECERESRTQGEP
jgi:hypothetical protein